MAGVAAKHTLAVKKTLPLKSTLGPVPATVTGLEVSASGTFESEPVNQPSPTAPTARVGSIAGSDTGIQFELEKA